MLLLTPPEPASTAHIPAAALLADTLMPILNTADGIEHASFRTGPTGLHIGLFSRPVDYESALLLAVMNCKLVIDWHPEFAGWQIRDA